MPEVRIDVYSDQHGAPENLKRTETALSGVERQGDATHGALDKLWKQFAVGNIVAQVGTKTFSLFKAELVSTTAAAQVQESADRALAASLEITGRTIPLKSMKDFASSLQSATRYGDEEIESVQTLLVQMTRLNREGLEKATKGAIGLATVMGIDLQSAASLVQKALEGNYGALSRYGIKVDENLNAGEKQAQLLEKLLEFYKRAEADVDTFAGRIDQLTAVYGDLKEIVGDTVIKSEDFKNILDLLKVSLQEFKKAGEEGLGVVGPLGAVMKATSDIIMQKFGPALLLLTVEQAKAVDEAKRQRIAQLDLNVLIGAGVKAWKAYVAAGGDVEKALRLARGEVDETGLSLEALREMAKAAGIKIRTDLVAELRDAEKTLGKLMEVGEMTPGTIAVLEKKIKDLRETLAGGKKELTETEKIFERLGIKTMPQMLGEQLKLNRAEAELTRLFQAGKVPLIQYIEGMERLHKEIAKVTPILQTALPASIRNMRTVFAAAVGGMESEVYGFKTIWDHINDAMTGRWQKTMADIEIVATVAFSGLDAVIGQSQRNREIAIDNEYKKRLAVINRTIVDEDAKQNAIMALEAEYQIKRSEAQRSGAKAAKAVALMEAVVNTASGVTRAYKDYLFPLSAIVAGIVGALGAIQIGLIAAQPIPLAKGAVFTQRTKFLADTGATYEMEGHEPEVVAPKSIIMEAVREAGGGGYSITINVNGPIIVTTAALTEEMCQRASSWIFAALDSEARVRGRLLQ